MWRAWQDETVRLLGGRTLSGFQPVTDPAVLNRLDEKARGGVRQIDLRALGITEFGTMQSRGFGRPTTARALRTVLRRQADDARPLAERRGVVADRRLPRGSGSGRRPRRQDRPAGRRLFLCRRPAAGLEGYQRSVGAWLLVVGLGQFLRTGRLAGPRAAAHQDRAAARPVRLPQRAAVPLPERAGGTRPAGRMVPRPRGGRALLLAAERAGREFHRHAVAARPAAAAVQRRLARHVPGPDAGSDPRRRRGHSRRHRQSHPRLHDPQHRQLGRPHRRRDGPRRGGLRHLRHGRRRRGAQRRRPPDARRPAGTSSRTATSPARAAGPSATCRP